MSEEKMEQLLEFIKNDRGNSNFTRILKLNQKYCGFS